MATLGVEYPARVRRRSSEKKAWLLSAPSTVLLFSRVLMPRKLKRPNPLESLTTPGVSAAKLDQRPPLIGKLEIAVWFKVGAKSADVVLICGASALTSTVSVLLPIAMWGESSVTLPTCTMTCSDLYGAKPCWVTVTVYVPGCSLLTRKNPEPSVVIVVSAFVPLLRTTIFALATTAPLLS